MRLQLLLTFLATADADAATRYRNEFAAIDAILAQTLPKAVRNEVVNWRATVYGAVVRDVLPKCWHCPTCDRTKFPQEFNVKSYCKACGKAWIAGSHLRRQIRERMAA